MEFIQIAFHDGGAVMYVILLFLFLVIGLALWRGMLLFLRFETVNPAGLWAEIYKQVTTNQIESAIRLCEKHSRAQILPRVWKKGLQCAGRTAEETQNAVESVKLERNPQCTRHLTWFGVIANVTTLLGLLGTISGLIKSFGAVSALSGAARQQVLAEGISHALNATGFGLSTALIAMLCHGVLTGKAAKLTEQTDEYSAKLIELLETRRASLSGKRD